MKNQFIAAIHSKSKLRVTFFSKEDRCNIIRTCAPMDFGPSNKAKDKSDRFHMWDYESDKKNHTLSLLPNQVVSIEILAQHFEPGEFITWQTNWFVQRDWGQYS